jgi:hypothetical protein
VSQADFAKRQRERARREKNAAKSAKKEERRSSRDAASTEEGVVVDEGAILAELAALHARFDAEEIDFETFAAAKEELTARLIS